MNKKELLKKIDVYIESIVEDLYEVFQTLQNEESIDKINMLEGLRYMTIVKRKLIFITDSVLNIYHEIIKLKYSNDEVINDGENKTRECCRTKEDFLVFLKQLEKQDTN